MLLLGRGVTAEQIEQAALRYGMPLSPLELIDWIGANTMFEAGRVFWQSFPGRLHPSPILPALIKAKCFGRASGVGFYDYVDGVRSGNLSPRAVELIQKYQRELVSFTANEVIEMLAIPMWIEASMAMREGIAHSIEQFELAMHGGLGFNATESWLGFFDSLGSRVIHAAITRQSSITACMKAPQSLQVELLNHAPSVALSRFAQKKL